MAKDDKVYMPSGMGGLIRYSEEEEEVIKLKPTHVIIISASIVVLELAIRFLFPA